MSTFSVVFCQPVECKTACCVKRKTASMHLDLIAGFAFLALCFGISVAKPVDKAPEHPSPVEADDDDFDLDKLGVHYEHYLKQVVSELEKDEEFKKKMEAANWTDIQSGKIAHHLEFVNHGVRSKLDELKRREIDRLRELISRNEHHGLKSVHDHLDKEDITKFGVKDLAALIKTVTKDLEEIDEQRRKEFKDHEIDKEARERQKLNHMSPEERKKEEDRINELKKKHKDHPKLHHPGSKDQFEEVWEKSDHLEDQEFDPKIFFMKHDLDGDGFWNYYEIDSVLQLELDKAYDPDNNPDEDDPWEREEEMNRMREHIMREMDTNKDSMISMEELIGYTGKDGENAEFNKDEGWKTIDEEEPVYTEEEIEEYMKGLDDIDDGYDDDLKFESEKHLKQPVPAQPQHQQRQVPGQPQYQQQQIPGQPQYQQQQVPQQQQQFQQQQQQQFQQQQQQQQFQQQQQQQQQQHPNIVGQPPNQVPVGQVPVSQAPVHH